MKWNYGPPHVISARSVLALKSLNTWLSWCISQLAAGNLAELRVFWGKRQHEQPPPSACGGKNRRLWLRCNWAGPIKLVQELFLNSVVRDIHSEFTLFLWWRTFCHFSVSLQQGQIIYKLLLWCHQFLLKLQQLQYWSERFTNAAREPWVIFPSTAEPRSENCCVENAFYFRIFTATMKGLEAIFIHLLPPGLRN